MPARTLPRPPRGALRDGARVIAPVLVEFTVGDEGAELEDGLGSVESPSGPCDVHSVFDQVTAGALDYPAGDRPAFGEGSGVVQVLVLGGEVAGAGVGVGAFALGGRVAEGGSAAAIPAATWAALPRRISTACSLTQLSASGSPLSKNDQAAFHRSRTCTKSQVTVTGRRGGQPRR